MTDTRGDRRPGRARFRDVTQFWTPENLLNLPVFGVSLLLVTIGNFSVNADPVERPLERVAVVALAHLALFGVFAAVTRLAPGAFRRRAKWPALAILVVAAGLARAVLIAAIFAALEIGAPLLWERLTFSLVTPSTLILLLVTARGALVSHAVATRRLAEVRRQLAEGEESVDRAELELEPGNVAELRRRLANSLSPVKGPSPHPEAAARALRDTIDTVVRPVSQGLRRADLVDAGGAATPAEPPLRLRVGSSLLDALDLRSAWPVFVPVVGMIQGLPDYVHAIGPVLGVTASAVGFVTSVALLGLARGAALRWPGRWSRLLHLPVSAVVGWAAREVPITLLGLPSSPLLLGAVIAFFVASGYLLAVAHSLYRRAAGARAAVSADNRRLEHVLARRRASVHVRQSAVARVLHGTVQARLTAAYLRLRMALDSGSPGQVSAALDDARHDVATALESIEIPPVPRRSVSDLVAELNETWDELADVVLVASRDAIERASRDPLTEAVLTELLPELVFNAIKHSTATSIRVDLDWPSERALRVRLEYDHRSAASPTTPSGLGDRTLDDVCLRWSRSFDATRGRTEAVLAWAE